MLPPWYIRAMGRAFASARGFASLGVTVLGLGCALIQGCALILGCALIQGCALDDRLLAVADEMGEETASETLAPAPSTDAGSPGAAGASSTPAASSPDGPAPVAGCTGLPMGRCECTVGESTLCGAEYVALGQCADRILICEAPGAWPPASACAPMGPELCDPGALDDDCDGQIDEGCTCINATRQTCNNGGVRVCIGGDWAPCLCEAEGSLDSDQNGVADSAETLLENGTFTSDLSWWDQSQLNHSMTEGILFQHVSADATQLACSGSMLLVSWESTGDNLAAQCVPAGAGTYVASARAFLMANTGSNPLVAALATTGVDPATVSLDLHAVADEYCNGAVLAEQVATTVLDPVVRSWQPLTTTIEAPAGTLGLLVRVHMVADVPTDGDLQDYPVRSARWDNVVLHAL